MHNAQSRPLDPNAFAMPKACVSCTRYEPAGFDQDEHCPFTDDWGRPKQRTPYGDCAAHSQEVFATEICGSYDCVPMVTSFPVPNRPHPRTPLQEQLSLQGGAA